MVSTRHHRPHGYWIFSRMVGPLCVLVLCTGAWAQGPRLPPADPRQPSAAKGLSVTVRDGRLSVDVQEADMAEVLAHIGRQAGIRIFARPKRWETGQCALLRRRPGRRASPSAAVGVPQSYLPVCQSTGRGRDDCRSAGLRGGPGRAPPANDPGGARRVPPRAPDWRARR